MKCGVCSRSKEDIISTSIVENRVTSKTEVEVFYLTPINQLICPRCNSEKLVPLGYNGVAYLTYYPSNGKVLKMKGIKINKKEIVTEDGYTTAEKEAITIETRDKIEKMMSQI